MALSWSAAYAASRDSAHFRFTSASASRSTLGGRTSAAAGAEVSRRYDFSSAVLVPTALSFARLQLLHRGAARAARPGPQRALCLEAALAPARPRARLRGIPRTSSVAREP